MWLDRIAQNGWIFAKRKSCDIDLRFADFVDTTNPPDMIVDGCVWTEGPRVAGWRFVFQLHP